MKSLIVSLVLLGGTFTEMRSTPDDGDDTTALIQLFDALEPTYCAMVSQRVGEGWDQVYVAAMGRALLDEFANPTVAVLDHFERMLLECPITVVG